MTTQLVLADFRFSGVQHPWMWLVLIPLSGVLLFAAYRQIYQRTSHRLVWWLMGLRVVGLLLLLLALAKPVWTSEKDLVDAGRVAVILDTSRSMELSDGQGGTRYGRATAAVEQFQKALAARPGPRLTVDLFDITGAPLEKLPDKPTAHSTDLLQAVKKTRMKMQSKPLAAMLLVSDGMDTTGRTSMRDLEDPRAPIFALGFPETVVSDLDLAVSLPAKLPERVLKNNQVRIEAPVAKVGKAPVEATVQLKRGSEVLAAQAVKFGEGSEQQTVALTFTPAQPGRFVYAVHVQAEAAERKLDNNTVLFPLRVDAEPIRVLYFEGFLREEFKFLKARLEDDPDLDVIAFVRRTAADLREKRPQLTAQTLEKIDVVVLGDMEGKFLTAAEQQQLVKWLDGKNHSLLVLGGYASFGPEGFRDTPLAAALPVTFAPGPPYQSEESFAISLTEKGQGHPIFTLSADRIKDAETWTKAPPLRGLSLVQGLKPGAEELAVNPKVRVADKPAVVAAVQRAPGGGQVLVLTADTTWLWSRVPRLLGQTDTLYARFWSQTVRWLAGRGLDDQRPPLTVSTDKPTYDVGNRVTVRVERQAGAKLEGPAQTSVELVQPDGSRKALILKQNSANPDLEIAEFSPETSGRYEVSAELRAGDKSVASQTVEFSVMGPDAELADVRVNPRALRELTQATGGEYQDMDGAANLAPKVPARERRTVRETTREYWDSPVLFSAFIVVVAGEWFLRRRNHLV
jgi:hypothetical protein